MIDKEKEIEVLGNRIRDTHYEIVGLKGELPMNIYQQIARCLVVEKECGYRKADEVRKEVIKEMMNYVLDKRHNSPLPDIELMKCFARKNGVEVGEK